MQSGTAERLTRALRSIVVAGLFWLAAGSVAHAQLQYTWAFRTNSPLTVSGGGAVIEGTGTVLTAGTGIGNPPYMPYIVGQAISFLVSPPFTVEPDGTVTAFLYQVVSLSTATSGSLIGQFAGFAEWDIAGPAETTVVFAEVRVTLYASMYGGAAQVNGSSCNASTIVSIGNGDSSGVPPMSNSLSGGAAGIGSTFYAPNGVLYSTMSTTEYRRTIESVEFIPVVIENGTGLLRIPVAASTSVAAAAGGSAAWTIARVSLKVLNVYEVP